MSKHIKTGMAGEKLAESYLRNKGWDILATNWRSGRYEVDIIGCVDQILVIVEVKTRSSDHMVFPETAVDLKKQKMLLVAAAQYMHDANWEGECRFDVIAVILDKNGNQRIMHFEDAFYPNPTDELS
jgi:putative endonuclease